MAKELIQNTEDSLFKTASPNEQQSIALLFLHALPDHEYRNKVEQTIENTSMDADQTIRAALHVYDLLMSDEIRSYLDDRSPNNTDAASVYYRSDVYKQDYPPLLVDALKRKVGGTPTNIVIATKEHLGRFQTESGFRGMVTPDLSYWVGTEDKPITLPDPPCGIARQEIFRSLMKCGVNPLEGVELNPVDESSIAIDGRCNIRFKRKGEVSLRVRDNEFELWENNSAKHWGRILRENEEHGMSILSSSGTSATEAVILALSNRTSGKTYTHPYWYYENIPTVQSALQNTQEVDEETQVVLLNLEPTNFFTFDESLDIKQPLETIDELVQICRDDPNVERYAVIDVTVDPLFKAKEHIGEIPDNLHIIKVLSASKHQRGDRKYFFGVAYTDNLELHNEIIEKRAKVGGDVYPSHIVHFPRPSAAWLKKQRDTVKLRNAEVVKSMEDDNGSGWMLKPHTYHTFFFPPKEVTDSIVRLGKQISDVADTVKLYNDAVYGLIVDTVIEMDTSEIDLGDSFGLPFTRICTQGGLNELEGVKFRLKLPRVCPGYDTPPELVSELSKRVLEKLHSSHDELMKILSSDT